MYEMNALITIPLVVIFIHLFSTLSLFVITQVLKIKLGESDEEKSKKKELLAYQVDLQHVSMVDDFPTYARIERKINKLKAHLAASSKEKSQKQFMWKMIGKCFSTVAGVILYMILLYVSHNEDVIELNPKWTYPLNGLLALPSQKPNVISATLWVLISRSVLTQTLDLLKIPQ